jgi:3-isopropylmalate/(R)-2-methylmalate dehydratase large subunit
VAWWDSLRSDADAVYDDVVVLNAADIPPTVTWGITPGQGIGVDEAIPELASLPEGDRAIAEEAYAYMDLQPGTPLLGTPVDVCFIGSCTNGRISDLREAAKVAEGHSVAPGIKAFVVPGSERVKQQAEAEGLDKIFEAAGFEWREAGCSMCLAMNPDKLQGRQVSASSSNRNFKGRQGSSSGSHVADEPRHGGHSSHRGQGGGCAIAAQPDSRPRRLGAIINNRQNPCLWNGYTSIVSQGRARQY